MKNGMARAALLLGGCTAVFLLAGIATAEPPQVLSETVVWVCDDLPEDDLGLGGNYSFSQPIDCSSSKVLRFTEDASIRSPHASIHANNVHFIVHEGASLTITANEAIHVKRDNGSPDRPLFSVAGHVQFNVASSLPAHHAHGTIDDVAGVVRLKDGGSMESDAAVRYTDNSVIVTKRPRLHKQKKENKDTHLDNNLPAIYKEQKESINDAMRSPANPSEAGEANTHTTAKDRSSPPEASSPVTSKNSSSSPAAIEPSASSQPDPARFPTLGTPAPVTPATTPPEVVPTPNSSGSEHADDGVPEESEDEGAKSSKTPSPSPKRYYPLPMPPPDDVLQQVEIKLRRLLTSSRPRMPGEPLSTSGSSNKLEVGQTLTGMLFSDDLNSAIWQSIGGPMMFGKRSPGDFVTGKAAGVYSTALIEAHPERIAEMWQMRKVLRVQEEEEKSNAGKKKNGLRGWFFPSTRKRHEKKIQVAKDNAGKMGIEIDNRGCLHATIDGITVMTKCGKRNWEWLNTFPWPREKSSKYELRVGPDGIEVGLGEKTVWGITADFIE